MFVWTFSGIMDAIILGVAITWLALFGIFLLIGNLKDKWREKFKKDKK